MLTPSDIPEEWRALLGREAPAETPWPVTGEDIRRYCQAVDDLNPLYVDEEAAAHGPYGGIIAPPLFHSLSSFRIAPLSQLREDGLPREDEDALRPPAPGAQTRLMGGDATLFEPVRPGDILTRRSRLADLFQKEGRSGHMVFSVRETRITNQDEALVCIERTTLASIEAHESARRSPEPRLALPPRAAYQPPPVHPMLSPLWGELSEDQELPEMVRVVPPVQVFLYGAVKGNSHLIHYDREYAAKEGLPERVAHGDLLGDLLCQTVTRWMGPLGTLRRFAYENRGPGFVNEPILHRGRVARRWTEGKIGLVEVELHSEGTSGRLCLRGTATVALPRTREG